MPQGAASGPCVHAWPAAPTAAPGSTARGLQCKVLLLSLKTGDKGKRRKKAKQILRCNILVSLTIKTSQAWEKKSLLVPLSVGWKRLCQQSTDLSPPQQTPIALIAAVKTRLFFQVYPTPMCFCGLKECNKHDSSSQIAHTFYLTLQSNLISTRQSLFFGWIYIQKSETKPHPKPGFRKASSPWTFLEEVQQHCPQYRTPLKGNRFCSHSAQSSPLALAGHISLKLCKHWRVPQGLWELRSSTLYKSSSQTIKKQNNQESFSWWEKNKKAPFKEKKTICSSI